MKTIRNKVFETNSSSTHSISLVYGECVRDEEMIDRTDFNNPVIFTQKIDAIALITGPLNITDTNHVRPILEWARTSENEEEFLFKVNKERVSSKDKKAKLKVFQFHLQNANGGIEITNNQLWEFLKHFHPIRF